MPKHSDTAQRLNQARRLLRKRRSVPSGISGGIISVKLLPLSLAPFAEIKPWVDEHHDQIGNQAGCKPKQGKYVERAKHYRVIALQCRCVAQQPQALNRKYGFNNYAASKKNADKRRRETRNNQQHAVAKHMAPKYGPFCIALALAVTTYCLLSSSRKLFLVNRRGQQSCQ